MPDDDLCGDYGPRIGDGRPVCMQPAGHAGTHKADESWGEVFWGNSLDAGARGPYRLAAPPRRTPDTTGQARPVDDRTELYELAAEKIRASCPSDDECLQDEDACFEKHPVHAVVHARRDISDRNNGRVLPGAVGMAERPHSHGRAPAGCGVAGVVVDPHGGRVAAPSVVAVPAATIPARWRVCAAVRRRRNRGGCCERREVPAMRGAHRSTARRLLHCGAVYRDRPAVVHVRRRPRRGLSA